MHTILHTARLHARTWEQQQLSYSSTGSSNDSSDNNDKGNSGNIGNLQWLQWQHTTMHTILHTARPHAHTWEQQQTSNGSNSSNSNSIDGSGGNDTDNSGAVGSPQWLQWQHSTVSIQQRLQVQRRRAGSRRMLHAHPSSFFQCTPT